LLIAFRAVTICALMAAAAARFGMRLLRSLLISHRTFPAEMAASAAAQCLVRLGPAYIKAGQLFSTRVDVLPASLCRALAYLHDRLPPMPDLDPVAVLPTALRAQIQGGTLSAEAAGSIACVYRARLRDGRDVAVKVRRPGIERTLSRDIALLRAAARLAERLPGMRGVPLAEMVTQVTECVRQQLDFVREAAALRDLRENLAAMKDVRIPAVIEEYSGPGVLVMEYIAGLRRGTLPGQTNRTALVSALHAVYHMLFLDGFVHCDLHPGNLYPMPDGSVVLVDAGFTRLLTEDARRKFASFFYMMSRGDGAACADIVLSTARSGSATDTEGFRESMVRLVENNSRASVGDFDLVGFTIRLFAIQREHGLYADPQFVFPVLSLIVLEGSLRAACRDVDFQMEALPFVLRGLMK
jgi:ubiquinone biosynthesis protein